jgi:hypothetical protein
MDLHPYDIVCHDTTRHDRSQYGLMSTTTIFQSLNIMWDLEVSNAITLTNAYTFRLKDFKVEFIHISMIRINFSLCVQFAMFRRWCKY